MRCRFTGRYVPCLWSAQEIRRSSTRHRRFSARHFADASGKHSFAFGGIALPRSSIVLCLVALCVAGCASRNASDALARGTAAYQTIERRPVDGAPPIYRIGPLDSLNVRVFGEPDLSAEAVQVDAAGNISLPLIGTIRSAGRTAPELSAELETLLGEKYLVSPQVTVSVASSISQRVVVEGEVVEPGTYELRGPTTLLGALSLAKGETRVASLQEVIVFRNIDGQRVGAVFDAASIRRGDLDDPQIYGSDLIVVGYSRAKGFWRDLLQASPILSLASFPLR